MSNKLKMTFDPMTIEHLGVRMYSTLPPVLSELISNAYDADSKTVEITLIDNVADKKIIVEDQGIGMSFDDINKKFLKIGRNRRDEDETEFSPNGRKVIGKKGLGKLSFFGIAHEIEISTCKDGKQNSFLLLWEDIEKEKEEYNPKILGKDEKCDPKKHGTKIILRKIQRESDFVPDELAISLSKIFIVEPDFKISVRHNSDQPIIVDNTMKYRDLDKEIEWQIPADISLEDDYLESKGVYGHLIATKKPISPKTNMRGIILFSRKKLVNIPEYFSDSMSSHFFSYLTGWLEVDFIDELDEDVIATDRQSLNWGHPEMIKLRENLGNLLNWLERDWRKKRAKLREKKLKSQTGIDVPDWFSKLPPNIKKLAEPIMDAIVKESELGEDSTSSLAKKLHEIVPEYPNYHWRNLHSEVKNVSEHYYVSGDYYTAFFESVKKYVNSAKSKTSSVLTDHALLENVFSIKDPKLSVTSKFKKPNGKNFEVATIENITEGHRMLVLGIWMACRSPIAHEEVVDLRDSGLFSEKDCLDALSLLSHLFGRLDNAELV